MRKVAICAAIAAALAVAGCDDQTLAVAIDGFSSGFLGVAPGTFYQPQYSTPQPASGYAAPGNSMGYSGGGMSAAQCVEIVHTLKYNRLPPGPDIGLRAQQLSNVFNANCLQKCQQVGAGFGADVSCHD